MVVPSDVKMNVNKILEDIPKLINSSTVRVVTEEQKNWWEDFLSSTLPQYLAEQQQAEWPLQEIIHKKLRRNMETFARPPLSEDLLNLHRRTLHLDGSNKVYTGARPSSSQAVETVRTPGDVSFAVGQMAAAALEHWKRFH
ncbi:uncharacterized protein [Ptychodera flava]|uniref:uncharacterized protein n=1 Tax=Ptychodera flava TaxID=63121 RepID=UPI003969D2F9